jgi:hypothetical protein
MLSKKDIGSKSPLCFIGYSLGSIMCSNYIYDIEKYFDGSQAIVSPFSLPQIESIRSSDKKEIDPVLKGETITSFYTIGSPLAAWSMRYENFGVPAPVPSKKLHKHYGEMKGEWVNFYDVHDVISYPIKGLNDQYNKAVKEDFEVKSPGPIMSSTPLDHSFYCDCLPMCKRIAHGLFEIIEAMTK